MNNNNKLHSLKVKLTKVRRIDIARQHLNIRDTRSSRTVGLALGIRLDLLLELFIRIWSLEELYKRKYALPLRIGYHHRLEIAILSSCERH